MINIRSNRNKFVIHGFFYSGAISTAEPSTVLPLIVNYFSSSNVLVGIFSSLLRGGAVIMQLYAAFHAQSYTKVINYLRFIFIFRFLSWFSIGLSIYIFGNTNPQLTLLYFGLGLFFFSFSAGFGTVYFQELMGKSFSKEYRGQTLAYRQFFAGLAAILSGFVSAWFLREFEKPDSFAYLFFASTIIMSIGYFALGSVKEFPKKKVLSREKNFNQFLRNTRRFLKYDKVLRFQIITMLISYSHLFALPFIVLNIKNEINLADAGILLAIQMSGAMLSNIVWGQMSRRNLNKEIVMISFILMILALSIAIVFQNFWWYSVLFFLVGSSSDGFKLAYNNLILIIASEDKRPIYVAIQNNLTSLGLFFSIPGGFFLNYIGFTPLVMIVIIILLLGLILSFRLK
jgi:MFS family permease